MYNKRLTCTLLMGCLNTLLAQSILPRKKTLFDNDWKFHLGHAADTLRGLNALPVSGNDDCSMANAS